LPSKESRLLNLSQDRSNIRYMMFNELKLDLESLVDI
jgi:hypothetical protein